MICRIVKSMHIKYKVIKLFRAYRPHFTIDSMAEDTGLKSRWLYELQADTRADPKYNMLKVALEYLEAVKERVDKEA